MKKDVLKNLKKFTGKHKWFAKFSRTPFLQNTSGRLLLNRGIAKILSSTSKIVDGNSWRLNVVHIFAKKLHHSRLIGF